MLITCARPIYRFVSGVALFRGRAVVGQVGKQLFVGGCLDSTSCHLLRGLSAWVASGLITEVEAALRLRIYQHCAIIQILLHKRTRIL